MKRILGWFILVIGWAAGLYVGGWTMFAQPIIEACAHFDAGTLTGVIIGTTIVKCIFAGAVSSIVIFLSSKIAIVLLK